MRRCAAVILAAGDSSRLGTPKQLVVVDGEPLLARVARTACSSTAERVIVVLGACADEGAAALHGLAVEIVQNADWPEGMASSIRAGVQAAGEADAVVLLLCDQPGVTAGLIDALIETSTGIAACRYGDAVGPPALFTGEFFDELLALRGDHGAKRLLKKHAGQVTTIAFPEGAVDIDTPDDLAALG